MPLVWSGNRRGIHDGTPPPHERDRVHNQLESAAGQPDSLPTPGIRREISVDNESMPLPHPWMPGILPHVERPTLSLQQVALVGSGQNTEGTPQPLP